MEAWKQIINTALLGTEKLPLVVDILPEKIQEKLTNVDRSEHESFFMKAATLMLAYRKAGEEVEKSVMPAIIPAESEIQPYCSQQAIVLLEKILDKSALNVPLLKLWIEKCRSYNWVLTPGMLGTILDIGAIKKARYIREDIRQIIGKRGNWLIEFNENWRYALPQYEEKLWQEGRIEERRDAFNIIRKREPAKAFEWLKVSWPEETAKDKKDFLLILDEQLNVEEEGFLQEIKVSLSGTKSLDKAINKELLATTERLLQKIENLKQKKEPVVEKTGLLSGLFRKLYQKTMTQEEKEFLSEVKWQNYEETYSKLETLGQLKWSAEFSQKILEEIKSDQNNYYLLNSYAPLMVELGSSFHPDIIKYLNDLLQTNAIDWQFNQYKKIMIIPLLYTLEIVAEINQL